MLRGWASALFCALLVCVPANAQSLFSNEIGTGAERCRQVSPDLMRRDPSYARELAWDQMMFGNKVHPCGIALQTFDPGTWERTPVLTSTDSKGRSSNFRLYVLDERFSWEIGSHERLEAIGSKETKFYDIFSRELFLNEFCSANSVVGIGTASHEGAADLNRRLAGKRAMTVSSQLNKVGALCEAGAPPPLLELNLGKHKDLSGCTTSQSCAGTTSPQRRLVIVAAEQVAPGANLEEALQDILERTRIINTFAVEDYHDFIVKQHSSSSKARRS